MSIRPPFDMLRAAFYLLAAIIGIEVLLTSTAGMACFWLIVSGQYKIGACSDMGDRIKEQWSEIVSAVLALLLAARSPPRPPPSSE